METFLQNNLLLTVVLILWVLPWKGYALWVAAHNRNKIWFIIILILNTFAILEIFYIFYIAKKKPSDILSAFKSKI